MAEEIRTDNTETLKNALNKITHLERKIASIRGSHRVDVAKLKARTEQVERLKQHNKELQEDLEHKKIAIQTRKARIKSLEEQNKELQKKCDEQEMILSQTTGYGRDKIKNLMDLYNSSLAQKSKRIAELEAQIEKMKCCQNCKHHYFMGNDLECKLIDCDNNESWELAK